MPNTRINPFMIPERPLKRIRLRQSIREHTDRLFLRYSSEEICCSDPPHRRHNFPLDHAPLTAVPDGLDTLKPTIALRFELDLPLRPSHRLVHETVRVGDSLTHASTARTRSPTSDPPTCGPMSHPCSDACIHTTVRVSRRASPPAQPSLPYH